MSEYLFLHNGRVITPMRIIYDGAVLVKKDKIVAVGAKKDITVPAEAKSIDVGGRFISPGFIDCHVHGGGGGDIMEGTLESVLKCGTRHAEGGITAFMPSTLTAPIADIERTIEACSVAAQTPYDGAKVIGVHLEGPYFNKAQAGAQNPAYIKNPQPEEYLPLLDHYSIIKRVTVAPELDGAMELGQELRKRGIVAAIGHSDTSYQQIVKAVENGYTHATHMYSAMSSFRREKAYRIAGVIESVLTIDELTTELIADGHHVPPSMIKMLLKAKGANQVCLTTDAMSASGLGPGEYEFFGLKVVVEDDIPTEFEVPSRPGQYVAKLADRSAFASSIATMDQVVRTMVQLAGLSVLDAVKMATLVPARIHHLQAERGMLSPGLKADLTVFDDSVNIHCTVVEGRIVFQSGKEYQK